MRAMVYHRPGRKAWEGVPDPEITDNGDAIVQVDTVTICDVFADAADTGALKGVVTR
jgi:hypothetical protein